MTLRIARPSGSRGSTRSLAVAWIAFSDRVADWIVSPETLSAVQTAKGIGFVLAITAVSSTS